MVRLATALLIIGGLNWGLIGLLNFNLVAAIFGAGSVLSRLIYILVGVAAVYDLVVFNRFRRVETRTGAPPSDFRRAA